MDRKFKGNACLKTSANSGVIAQVYQNSMKLFTHYAQVVFQTDASANDKISLIGSEYSTNQQYSTLLNQQFEKSLKSRKQFEIKFMSDIESSLNGALDNLNVEKVSFRLSANVKI